LNGLNLSVGGNQAADGPSFNGDRAYFHRSLAEIGVQDRQDSQQRERKPNPPPPGRRMRIVRRCQPVVFQLAAGITVSSNLPFRRPRQIRIRPQARIWLDAGCGNSASCSARHLLCVPAHLESLRELCGFSRRSLRLRSLTYRTDMSARASAFDRRGRGKGPQSSRRDSN
jgi:hypothetical protein